MVWGELPRQGSCQGNLLHPSALCGLGLGVALIILGFGLTLAHLPVLLGVTVGAAPTARAQVKGYKSVPLFLYTDHIRIAKLAFHAKESPSGHRSKSSILYLHSPTVRPKDTVRLSGDPLIQDSLKHRTPERCFADVLEGSRLAAAQCWQDIVFE